MAIKRYLGGPEASTCNALIVSQQLAKDLAPRWLISQGKHDSEGYVTRCWGCSLYHM